MTDALPPARPPKRHPLRDSFRFAIVGLIHFYKTQRNARIQLVAAAITCAVALWLRISYTEWAILVFAMACVTILEGVNTALEATVDLASPEIHPLAKTAKDVSAGMVLLAAIASAVVGLLILGPPLWQRLGATVSTAPAR